MFLNLLIGLPLMLLLQPKHLRIVLVWPSGALLLLLQMPTDGPSD